MPSLFVVDYASSEQFVEAVDLEVSNGGLLVRGVRPEGTDPACRIEVRVAGETVAEVDGLIGTVGRTGVAVTFEDVPFELVALADRYRAPAAPEEETAAPEAKEPPRGTITERLAELTVAQKMQLALSGDRETRIALLRDHNKVLHVFVLRNPRIQLDEILFAAKLNSLSPDALKFIAEHVEWGQNLQVITGLVRNPRSPLTVALRLLPKLSQGEIRAIAKGGARDQLMHAARRLLSA